MRARSLLDLRLDAAKLADLEGYIQPTTGSDSRYSIPEVNRYINQGIAELWDLLVSAQGYAYYGKTHVIQSAYAQSGAGPSLTGRVLSAPRFKESGAAKTLLIKITTGGALATATFQYAVSAENGGAYYETVYTTQSDGVWTHPSGISIDFPSGTYVLNEVYTITFDKPSTVAGTVSYDLPNDFYKMHKMWVGSPNTYDFLELERTRSGYEPWLRATNTRIRPTNYELRNNCVDLLPTPQTAETITMLYVPSAPVLQNDSDAFDGINGFEDYVAAVAASRMLLKEGDNEYINTLTGLMTNKVKARIVQMASDRDKGTPERVTDTRGAIAGRFGFNRRRRVY